MEQRLAGPTTDLGLRILGLQAGQGRAKMEGYVKLRLGAPRNFEASIQEKFR